MTTQATTTVHELYAVSDLHLGGSPGFQIFKQGPALAAFIESLAAQPADRKIALVLNGDVVDFLAEDGAGYLSAAQAVGMLERIFRDEAFAPVWRALARYTSAPGRLLVICLGNHDIELALPPVHERLLAEICPDAAARGRVVTSMNGAGFACDVGGARVFASHGNEVDPWNIVDYRQLGAVAEAQQQGQALPAWDPNAGTQLVIDVMNVVKKKFPFVDLLKPETSTVPRILLAFDPSTLGAVKNVGSIFYRRLRGSMRAGFMSEGGSAADAAATEDQLRDLLLPKGWREETAPKQDSADDLMARLQANLQAGHRPGEGASGAADLHMMGAGQYLWDRFIGHRDPADALRDALADWLTGDETFAITTADDTYKHLDETTSPEVDFVLAGHTHLARAIKRKNGGGAYFNSGTWIRLIRLTPEILGSADAFGPVYTALRAGTMDAIDAAPGLVWPRPTVVRVRAEPGGTAAELTTATLEGGRIALVAEAGSRFVKA